MSAFGGKSGHGSEATERLLLTQSGHRRVDFAVAHNGFNPKM
jgi:hypothetical protein